LCRALAAAGHAVHVFTTNVDGLVDSDVPLGVPVDLDGVKVWYFPCSRLRRIYHSPAMARALEERTRDFDVVHLHSIFLWPTWAAARAARAARKPYVLAPRGMLERDLVKRKSYVFKAAWIALVERSNLERAAAIHATSEREADEARAFGFRLPRIAVVPNGVEVPLEKESAAGVLKDDRATDGGPGVLKDDRATDGGPGVLKDNGATDAEPYLLYLGRVNWKKGLDRLIAAMPCAPGARLVVAGNDEEGYEKNLRAQALRMGVADRVTFTGPVYGPAKWRLYRQATGFVLASYSENFGNVVLEAMACGIPVIVTPQVGVAHVVETAGAGIVAKGTPEALGSAVCILLGDPAAARAMGERGRALVASKYTWHSVAHEVADLYREILIPA
jgi:glycosyltransferase involved in cell wall biosynthesis